MQQVEGPWQLARILQRANAPRSIRAKTRRPRASGRSGVGMRMESQPRCSPYVVWVSLTFYVPVYRKSRFADRPCVLQGSFLPLTLEQLARERGTLHDSHLPCVGPGSPSESGKPAPAMLRRAEGEEQCVVGVFGLQISTASFAMYTFSLAVLVQAFTLISFSALADYG